MSPGTHLSLQPLSSTGYRRAPSHPACLLVLGTNSGSCGYTTGTLLIDHLLSHLPRSSFWEAFAKSEFGTQVCCNSMRGRCNKKPAGLGKEGSWALAAGKLLHKDCLSEVSRVGTLEPIPEPEGQRICSSEV